MIGQQDRAICFAGLVAGAGVLLSTPASAEVFIKKWQECMPEKHTIAKRDYAKAQFDVPESGGTGLFFVRKNNGKEWVGEAVKFPRYPETGTVLSRKVFKKMKLPHDPLIAWSVKESEIHKARSRIQQAVADGKFPQVRQGRATMLAQRLNRNRSDQPGSPAALLRTGLVPAAGAGETFGAMLSATSPNLTDRQRANDMILAVRALKYPANQQFLGALYVADLVLGNGDRLSKQGAPNLNNIVIGRRNSKDANAPACLVAIDNDAVMPSIDQILFNEASRLHPNGGHNITITMGSVQLLDRLLINYEDETNRIPVFGPGVAFEAPTNAVPAPCSAQVDRTGLISSEQLHRIVSSLRQAIGDGVANLAEVTWQAHQRKPNCVGFVNYQPPQAPLVSAGIDWGEFENNFQQGVDYAIQFFTNTRNHSREFQGAIKPLYSADGLERVEWEGMQARIDFLKAIMADPQVRQTTAGARAAMANNPKLSGRKYRVQQTKTFSNIALYDDWGVLILN